MSSFSPSTTIMAQRRIERRSTASPRCIISPLGSRWFTGSVRARANKYRLCWDEANPGSCGLQDGQHGRGPPEMEQSLAVGGNMLMGAGAETEEVAQFIVSPAEPGGRSGALEAPHGPVEAFDAAVILLEPVVQLATGPVPHTLAQLGADCSGVAVVAVGRDPVRRDARDCLGGAEERLRGRPVPVLAEQHIHERTGAVDGAIEVAPAPV